MRPINIAVVGTGWVAGEYIRTVLAHPETELYAIVSNSEERARQRLAEFNATAHVFTDYAKAVQDPNVDAVVLCAMPDDRPEQAVLAARHGKHIVMEKPLSMHREALWTMRDALEKWPVRTVASFVLRWVPSMKNTKALIQDDAIGRPFMVNIDYWHHVGPQYGQFRWSKTKQSGGSSILSAGCHAVDAVRYLAGDIEEVTAYSSRTWADTEYEFDPNAIAIFKLRNGGIGKVSSSLECKMPYKFNVHILGEKGTIMNNQLYSHKLPGQNDFATIPAILPDSGDVTHHPFAEEIDDFVQSIRHGKATRCEFDDAYRSMELCFAIDESIATGKSVKLPLQSL